MSDHPDDEMPALPEPGDQAEDSGDPEGLTPAPSQSGEGTDDGVLSGGDEEPEDLVVPVVYSNMVGVRTGPYDVMLDFALQLPESEPGAFNPEDIQVRVAMSWPHLKSMIPLFARIVADYEVRVGPITSPGFDEAARS